LEEGWEVDAEHAAERAQGAHGAGGGGDDLGHAGCVQQVVQLRRVVARVVVEHDGQPAVAAIGKWGGRAGGTRRGAGLARRAGPVAGGDAGEQAEQALAGARDAGPDRGEERAKQGEPGGDEGEKREKDGVKATRDLGHRLRPGKVGRRGVLAVQERGW